MSCPKFDVAHPRANCRPNNGDFLSLGSRRLQLQCPLVDGWCSCTFPLRFCQNNGPSNFTVRANKLLLQFRSNRRVHGKGADCTIFFIIIFYLFIYSPGEGAECTIACSDFTPRAETNPVTCSPEGNVLNWHLICYTWHSCDIWFLVYKICYLTFI